jgi:hypothetical protein
MSGAREPWGNSPAAPTVSNGHFRELAPPGHVVSISNSSALDDPRQVSIVHLAKPFDIGVVRVQSARGDQLAAVQRHEKSMRPRFYLGLEVVVIL